MGRKEYAIELDMVAHARACVHATRRVHQIVWDYHITYAMRDVLVYGYRQSNFTPKRDRARMRRSARLGRCLSLEIV